MKWNRSNSIGISRALCTHCHGDGTRLVRKEREVPCNCVFRAAFRACWNRFRECVALGERASTVTLDLCNGRDGRRTYSRKREEFMADFCLISRRVLDDLEFRAFRYHFLLGADWKLCCRQLNMDRGDFFHIIYTVEEKLGQAFAEVEPYPLYPIDEYFTTSLQPIVKPAPLRIRRESKRSSHVPLRLPLSA